MFSWLEGILEFEVCQWIFTDFSLCLQSFVSISLTFMNTFQTYSFKGKRRSICVLHRAWCPPEFPCSELSVTSLYLCTDWVTLRFLFFSELVWNVHMQQWRFMPFMSIMPFMPGTSPWSSHSPPVLIYRWVWDPAERLSSLVPLWLGQEAAICAHQGYSGWCITCCAVPAADAGVSKVPEWDKSLKIWGSWLSFCVPFHLLFLIRKQGTDTAGLLFKPFSWVLSWLLCHPQAELSALSTRAAAYPHLPWPSIITSP